MSLMEIVREALAEVVAGIATPDGVLVTTHCMYPSGTFTSVRVRGGSETFYVSDDGGAVREIESAGASIENPDKFLRNLVASHGLSISNGSISYGPVSRESLSLAIPLVANASREVAEWLFAHVRIPRSQDFRLMLRSLLKQSFSKRLKEETLIGQSNKAHKFEQVIHLPGGKLVLVDPVLNDPNSINSRVVAHMDVRLASHEGVEQRLVYDDEEPWSPENLSLLHVGVNVVMPFSKAASVFNRMAYDITIQ